MSAFGVPTQVDSTNETVKPENALAWHQVSTALAIVGKGTMALAAGLLLNLFIDYAMRVSPPGYFTYRAVVDCLGLLCVTALLVSAVLVIFGIWLCLSVPPGTRGRSTLKACLTCMCFSLLFTMAAVAMPAANENARRWDLRYGRSEILSGEDAKKWKLPWSETTVTAMRYASSGAGLLANICFCLFLLQLAKTFRSSKTVVGIVVVLSLSLLVNLGIMVGSAMGVAEEWLRFPRLPVEDKVQFIAAIAVLGTLLVCHGAIALQVRGLIQTAVREALKLPTEAPVHAAADKPIG